MPIRTILQLRPISTPPPATEEVEMPSECRTALHLLLRGHQYAGELSLSGWTFALEIADLYHAGVGKSDLRWLLCKGYLEHGHEYSSPDGKERRFRRGRSLVLSERSCFVLTAAGLAQAQRLSSPEGARKTKPKYLTELKELWLAGELVKQFKTPAPNQEVILSALEEENWPVCIDDPLRPTSDISQKRRLRDTIYSLNQNQKRRLIHFSATSNGKAIRWQPII